MFSFPPEGQRLMTLAFPNSSRSYDRSNRRIRFSGYDDMFEISFFIEIDALAKAFGEKMSGENEYLLAFDRVRSEIVAAALKAHGRSKGSKAHTLTLADFR
jgi:hypothetical protein